MIKILKIYLVLNVLSVFLLNAQEPVKQLNRGFSAIVLNENNEPIQNARVSSGETTKTALTDETGKFTLLLNNSSDVIRIEAEGYSPRNINLSSIDGKIILKKQDDLYGEKSLVNLGYAEVKKGEVLGAVTQTNPGEYLSYDTPISISDLLVGRVGGMINANNIRGMGNALVIVDGIPRYDYFSAGKFHVEEIESLTVLRDVSAAALYGSQANNGVIIVKTKQGAPNTRKFKISGRYAFNAPVALPKYLNSADYMSLYNEARQNDGLTPLYSDAEIENFRRGNSYQYPDVDYYSSEYIKPASVSSKILSEFSGGSKGVTYYTDLGWTRNGSFIDFGEAKNMGNNRLNARGNLTFQVNNYIKNSVGANAVFNFNKSPRTDYFSAAKSLRPNFYPPFLPIDLMDMENQSIQDALNLTNHIIDGKYLLGGTAQTTTNPFATIYAGGYQEVVNRLFEFNDRIDIDLNGITEGLSFVGNFGFDFFNQFRQSIDDSYAVYVPTWSDDGKITSLAKYGEDKHTGDLNVGSSVYYRRLGFYGQFNYERTFNEKHSFNAILLAAANTYVDNAYNASSDENKFADYNSNLGLRLAYDYNKTYFINLSNALINSVKLPEGNRIALNPSIALGWMLSNMDYFKDINWLDYLKVKTSAGIINTDETIGGYYYYDELYGSYSGYSWNDGTSSTSVNVPLHGKNPNLGFEKRKEINLGFESMLANKTLSVDVNYFHMKYDHMIGRMTGSFPAYYSNFIPYGNNYGANRTNGLEWSVNYNKKLSDINFSIGTTGLFLQSKAISRDEFWANDYQYRAGRDVSAIFGLESMGLFQSVEEINAAPFHAFGETKPGDIRYKDQNDDGVVDSNDQIQIGKSTPSVVLGLNVNITYKNFTLFAMGNAQFGADSQISGSYYRMSGDDKYSVLALQRWTEQTRETAEYPRLTTKSATNNNQTSTFWMYKRNIFDLSRVQLTYEVPANFIPKVLDNGFSFFLSGTNLMTIGPRKDVRTLSFGNPYCRTFTLGVQASF